MRLVALLATAAAGALVFGLGAAQAVVYGGSSLERTGTVLKEITYEYPDATGVNSTDGFWQCADNTPSDGATRGTLTADSATAASGRHSGQIVNPPTGSGTFGRSACEVLMSHTIKSGDDIYYGMALRFPRTWSGHDSWQRRAVVAYFGYIALQGPISVEVYNNRIALALAAGACTPGVGCAYDNSCGGECIGHANDVACFPKNGTNPYHGISGCKIVPAGQLTLGVWHEIIVHVRESPRANGMVEAWWKLKSARRWQKTVTMTHTATLELGVNTFGQTFDASVYDAGTSNESDKFGLQDASPSASTLNQDDDCVATSFAAAASCFLRTS